MAAIGKGRDVANAAHHDLERALGRRGKVSHLAAHFAQGEPRIRREALRVGRIRHYQHVRLGDHAVVAVERAPRIAFRLDALHAAVEEAADALAGAREARDDEALGRHPRAARKPPARAAHRARGDLAGAVGVDELEKRRRISLRPGDGGKPRGLIVVLGELQHAAAIPLQVIAVVLQRAIVLQGVEEGAA